MFTILAILAAGLICGRIYLHFTRRAATLAENLLGYVVWFMLAAFGLRIGSDPDIMGNLHLLGLQALVLGAAATILSGWLSVSFSDDSHLKTPPLPTLPTTPFRAKR